jgi:tetratricopeptide (TPR) repeat protein
LTENHSAEQPGVSADTNESVGNEARKFPRYIYRSPEKPGLGDRASAERAFAQGVQEQQVRKLPEAIQAYRRAAQVDPGFFDAHYNLGLAASENGNLGLALAAYETALAIQPESLDARYNFGLVLKQAGYVLDAMAEFERILTNYPNDSRTHLALGNLYAQQLQQPAKARPHYLAVLATAPQSPQAGAIRYWLSDHPR